MKRVAIYCRLSDEDKNKDAEDESQSIQNQKNLLTNYAMENGWNIYGIYSDDDWSGLDSMRPEWNRMIQDAEAKKFDIILCKSQSRFTRDMEVVEKYLHKWFLIWGIRFIGYADFADTDNKGNKKQRQINGLVNEWYCEDLSENIKVVFDKKRRDGKFIGSMSSYGYAKDPNRKGCLIVDEEAAAIVKRIFLLYLEGYGSSKIANILNEEGIPNPTKYKQLNGVKWSNGNAKDNLGLWNRTTIKRILKNEMYLGHMVQGIHKKASYKSSKQITMPKENWFVVKNTHEPIVNEDEFLLVQSMMNDRRKSDGRGKSHVLAGKVKCADCSSNLSRITPHKRHGGALPYQYLRCSMSEKKTSICKGHYIRLDKLEEITLNRMKVYLSNVDEKLIKENLQQMQSKKSSDIILRKIQKIDRELEEKKTVIEELYVDKVKGIISEIQFHELSQSFQNQIEHLNQRKKTLIIERDIEMTQKQKSDSLEQMIKRYKNIEILTPKLVNEFIEAIFIGEKDRQTGEQKIHIIWRY